MTAMLPSKLVLLLCFVGSVLAQFESICNYDCVATDVYEPYCGGAVCVHGETDPSQHEALCSQGCADAILGEPMRTCVYSRNPTIRNLVAETRNMVTFIQAFCDRWDVEHNIVVPDHPIPAPAPALSGASGPAPVPEPFMTLDDLDLDTPMDVPATPPAVVISYPEPVVAPTMDPPVTSVMMDSPVALMSEASPERIPDMESDAIDDLNEI